MLRRRHRSFLGGMLCSDEASLVLVLWSDAVASESRKSREYVWFTALLDAIFLVGIYETDWEHLTSNYVLH